MRKTPALGLEQMVNFQAIHGHKQEAGGSAGKRGRHASAHERGETSLAVGAEFACHMVNEMEGRLYAANGRAPAVADGERANGAAAETGAGKASTMRSTQYVPSCTARLSRTCLPRSSPIAVPI